MRNYDARADEILSAVVSLNIETGKPVSSGLVERYLGRAVSSATIRSVMQRLEQDGFLNQPHTSAGRLPTDAGFRAFVNYLQAGWSLRQWETPVEMVQMLEHELPTATDSVTEIKTLAGLLSRLTDNISIVLGPSWEMVRAVRVELYPRSSRQILMVVILENAQVRTGLLELTEDYPAAVVDAAGQLLSQRIKGKTVGELRCGAMDSLDLLPTPITRCAAALSIQGRELFQQLEKGELELDGVANVLEEPEFHDPAPLKSLIRFIESPRSIRRSLQRLDQESHGDLNVWIGRENPVGDLRKFTVLTGRFDLQGRKGILAVLGPRRMSYRRVMHGMDILRRVINDRPNMVAS